MRKDTTKEFLSSCPVTYEGANYKPFTHKAVIETIDEYLDYVGLLPLKELYLHASNGQKAIGRIAIDTSNLGYKDFTYELSWKNSLDGTMSFGICSGIHTFICANGSVYGDSLSFKRRHTSNSVNDIQESLKWIVEDIIPSLKLHEERMNRMAVIELSELEVAALCGDLVMNKEYITMNQFSTVKQQLKKPTIDYGCAGTLRNLYEVITFAIKESNPMFWHGRHLNLTNYFKEQLLSYE